MKNILEIAELLGIEAMFFGAMFAMGWAVVHGQWTLFFAAAAMTYSMEYHIDKKTG